MKGLRNISGPIPLGPSPCGSNPCSDSLGSIHTTMASFVPRLAIMSLHIFYILLHGNIDKKQKRDWLYYLY